MLLHKETNKPHIHWCYYLRIIYVSLKFTAMEFRGGVVMSSPLDTFVNHIVYMAINTIESTKIGTELIFDWHIQ